MKKYVNVNSFFENESDRKIDFKRQYIQMSFRLFETV